MSLPIFERSYHHYLSILQDIAYHNEPYTDRTGTGIYELWAKQIFVRDITKSFPIIAGKRTNYDAAIAEMRWMMSGSTNINDLDSKIWDEWADENGDLGPTYGAQLRAFNRHTTGGSVEQDQLATFLAELINNPGSRRHMLTLWNPTELDAQALPPCITQAQARVRNGILDLHVYQRSADIFLGVPFDLVGWAYLQTVLAALAGYTPGSLTFSYGSLHLYANHLEAAGQYRDQAYKLNAKHPAAVMPQLRLDTSGHALALHAARGGEGVCTIEDAQLLLEIAQTIPYTVTSYDPKPFIKAQVAV